MSKTSKSGDGMNEMTVLPPIDISKAGEAPSNEPATRNQSVDGPPTITASLPSPHDSHGHRQIPRHRFISPVEWTIIANSISGVKDHESHKPAHPTHWLWPPLGMPHGLYREVVSHKYRFLFLFHVISFLRGLLMIVQLLVGATLTALGAMSLKDGKPITILAAVNTAIAGILALLHNSGLPDRYRNDMAEFEELEDHIKEVLDSSIAPADQTTEQILAECFDLYRDAKATVAVNMPANYAARQGGSPARQSPSTLAVPPPVQQVASPSADDPNKGQNGTQHGEEANNATQKRAVE